MAQRRAHLRSEQRPIEAILEDGSHHYLEPSVLDVLLEKNQITKFRRSNGWVTVGVHPIRVRNRREAHLPFDGPDRRSPDICWI